MPKLYEYLGIIVLFYSNEHEPIHVHGKYKGTESKAEFIIDNGKIVDIRFGSVKGKRPLNPVQLRNFQALVKHYAEEIVQKDRLLRASQTGKTGENYEENTVILSEDAVIEIQSADYVADYKLWLQFSDGQERLVDFEPFLRHSLNPMIRAYLDIEKFKQFTVEYGDLHWNDYDLCFPIADLYEGRI